MEKLIDYADYQGSGKIFYKSSLADKQEEQYTACLSG